MNNLKRTLVAGAITASVLASALPAFAHNPNQVDTSLANCHGKLVSLNAKGHGGLKAASEVNHPNYGNASPAESVQDFQNEIHENCSE